jgi:DNA-3-methyladenine glycosylase
MLTERLFLRPDSWRKTPGMSKKQSIKKLPKAFYTRPEVTDIARELLGKYLFTNKNGELTGGMIVETEAYAGVTDMASHAWNGRFTPRTSIMYDEGGVAYVYFCYGIHYLFNVVTNVEGMPHAVLVRALEPTHGIDIMMERRGKIKTDRTLCGGPGALAAALALDKSDTGADLGGDTVWLEDRGITIKPAQIISSPRVGVAYAKEHALWPYRFRLKDSPWTSPAK